MRLPSLNHIAQKTTSTLKRFPLTLLSALTAVALSIYLIERSVGDPTPLFNIILVALLGIPLFTLIVLGCEKKGWARWPVVSVHILGILLLLCYYFTLPADFDNAPYSQVYRYMLYFIGVHLLVAIGPYWNRGKMSAFWDYNKTLLLRFLTAILFSGALFAGLSIALLSIDVLLEISIDEKRYLQLFIFLGGIFNTWFFLAGIPPMHVFDEHSDYPKGLKIFTQNILIPLVIIYLAILYLYTGKILLQWSWPEGWVANLILSFSIAGILALLLLHPIQDKVENRWIKRFSTGYFWALVPLVILLMMAIYRRVWEYGITVERYFVIILGLWLAGIVIYFVISKTRNIKVIPGSLCVLVFFISLGPWGAFSVSERSQVNRLQHFLQENEILRDGSIQKISGAVSFEVRKEISDIVRYLNTNHGVNGIQPWFQRDLTQLTNQPDTADTAGITNYRNRPEKITELMGIDYVNQWETMENQAARNRFYTALNNIIDVNDAAWLIQDIYWSPQNSPQDYAIGNGRTLIIESSSEPPHLRIFTAADKQNVVSLNLNEFIEQLNNKFSGPQREIPANDMTVYFADSEFAAAIYYKNISWITQADSIRVESAQFNLGLK